MKRPIFNIFPKAFKNFKTTLGEPLYSSRGEPKNFSICSISSRIKRMKINENKNY